MNAPRTPKIPYGGDHNPEQWPEEVWDEDHRLFTRAGIDTLTVGVFSWSLTQPAPATYDFTKRTTSSIQRCQPRDSSPRSAP